MTEKLIFVVDSDKKIQNLLEYTISGREGFKVIVFPSGEECLMNLDVKPDIIILDHLFTGKAKKMLNGMQTFSELRKINKALQIIILSEKPNQKIIKELYVNDATNYISKNNYFIDSLLETIDRISQN